MFIVASQGKYVCFNQAISFPNPLLSFYMYLAQSWGLRSGNWEATYGGSHLFYESVNAFDHYLFKRPPWFRSENMFCIIVGYGY